MDSFDALLSQESNNNVVKEFKNWLDSMGFFYYYYNEENILLWKYAIKIDNVRKYTQPIVLSRFEDRFAA